MILGGEEMQRKKGHARHKSEDEKSMNASFVSYKLVWFHRIFSGDVKFS